jgi:hypothetical protein
MHRGLPKKRSVTTADTVKAMRDTGIEVSEKDAEIILEFLYFLAKLTVKQYINNNYSDDEKAVI